MCLPWSQNEDVAVPNTQLRTLQCFSQYVYIASVYDDEWQVYSTALL